MVLMEVDAKDFEEEVLKSSIPVLVEFWGSWCPPCKMMDPLLSKLEKEFEGRVRIRKVNTDRNPYLRDAHEIRGLPTFILFRGGKEAARHVAAKSEEELRGILSNKKT